ncbi:hypothetical protein JB92DRAFT_2969139 [Gautieria morchelliformis]|nr:hypothetical protein JB92DRAFT_2969139 [Gautieria morchelliformis]
MSLSYNGSKQIGMLGQPPGIRVSAFSRDAQKGRLGNDCAVVLPSVIVRYLPSYSGIYCANSAWIQARKSSVH